MAKLNHEKLNRQTLVSSRGSVRAQPEKRRKKRQPGFLAKYKGTCVFCQTDILVGQRIGMFCKGMVHHIGCKSHTEPHSRP